MRWSLNQSRFSLSSLKLNIFGNTIIGTQVISITETLTGDIMFGNGPLGIGMVIGTLSGDAEIGLIPEEDDNLLQSIGSGFMEIPISLIASFYEPAGSGIYTVTQDAAYIREGALDGAREGAVIKRKLKMTGATNWNGVTALDLASRASSPSLVGALFQDAGLSLSL